MQRTMLFKKFLMPCGLCAAVPVMKPVNPQKEQTTPCSNETQPKKLIKPSDLPIYSVDDGQSKQMPCIEEQPSIVEENVRKVRQSVQGLKVVYDKISDSVSSSVENFNFLIDYLQDKSNFLPQVGAVGIGGATGFLVGIRGGFFKRLLCTSVGAGIVGSICFPQETKEAFNTVEHYGNIGYNFIYGVKPGDNKMEISLNDFPLLKTLVESNFYQKMSQLFEKNSSNTTTEKMEEKSPENKSK
ncbi:MICOS complex subunit 26/27 [Colletes latitarsis]|uniref:MICOS complex subunit 26/27 n=1 Tax=Colletes latitarsis TaxID=2605962 RepID=UPI0040367994